MCVVADKFIDRRFGLVTGEASKNGLLMRGNISKIGSGEIKTFDVEFRILGSAVDVQLAEAEIARIQAGRSTEQVETPMGRE